MVLLQCGGRLWAGVPSVCTLHAPVAARISEPGLLLHDENENHYESMKECHFGLDALLDLKTG